MVVTFITPSQGQNKICIKLLINSNENLARRPVDKYDLKPMAVSGWMRMAGDKNMWHNMVHAQSNSGRAWAGDDDNVTGNNHESASRNVNNSSNRVLLQ